MITPYLMAIVAMSLILTVATVNLVFSDTLYEDNNPDYLSEQETWICLIASFIVVGCLLINPLLV